MNALFDKDILEAIELAKKLPKPQPAKKFAHPKRLTTEEAKQRQRESARKYAVKKRKAFVAAGLTTEGKKRQKRTRRDALKRLYGYGTKEYRKAYMRIWRSESKNA